MSTVDILADHVDELRQLYPALRTALDRDQRGLTGTRGGRPTFAAIVNADVHDALHAIERGTQRLDHQLAGRLGTDRSGLPAWRPAGHTPPPILRALPAAYTRLAATNAAEEALALVDITATWRHLARAALGLSRRPARLGYDCPVCTVPVPLLVGGAEGTLLEQHDPGDPGVIWRHAENVHCPACGSYWERSAWPGLGRQLAALEGQAALADTAAIAALLRVSPATVRWYAWKGWLHRAGRDSRGRTLYSVHEALTTLIDRYAEWAETETLASRP